MELIIRSKTGEARKTVSPDSSSQWAHEVGVENVVNVNFTTWEFFVLSVGDYIEVDGHKFSIRKEYRPKQADRQKYTYSLKFYGREHDAEDILFCRLTQGGDDLESVFAYDGTPMDFLLKAVQNLNRNTDGVTWKAGEAVSAGRRTVSFNGLYCWDALNEIARDFETEWWVDGEYLNLCKCERGERVTLGYMQGLKTGLAQQENTNAVKWFTRLIPVGSTKNIDSSKYGFPRLQLPSRAGFIDLNTQLGLKEHREEAAFAEIYPHRTGTVSAVRPEEKTNEETGEYTVYYVKDMGIPFNPDDHMLPGLVIHISFTSGDLRGKDFECNWHNDTQEFEIINTYPDENTQIPGGNLVPAAGDTYILWNIRMPDSYITAAEQQYEAAVSNFLSEYAKDVSIYSADTDYIYADHNSVPLSLGQRVKLLSPEYFGTDGGYRDSRMTRVVRKLNNLSEANLEFSDAVNTSWKSSVESSINNMEYTIGEQQKQGIVRILKTGDTEAASEYNAFSALRSMSEFISKKKDDIVRGTITFLKGIKTGKYTPGWTGTGGALYVDGNTGKTRLEVDEVLARDRFDTMEFRFNRIDVIDGEQWSTFAFGRIKSADTENRTVCLDLVDGELMSSHVNDLCRGIFHNLAAANAAGSKMDDCGFYTHAGFSTSYFTPTEILADGSGFKYALRPGTTQHPCAGMKFAAYGSLTDPERRMSRVTNTKHTIFLKDVATWQIDPDQHYGSAYGDLTGVTVNGVTFNGYSSFQTNGYFKGHIEFLPEQMEDLKGDGGYSVSLTSYDAIVAVDSQGRIDSSVYDILNVVDGDELVVSGDSQVAAVRYKIQTAIQAFKGAEELAWAGTPGEGTYAASVAATGCTCVLNGGVLTVTGITRDKAAAVIEVNCEGKATFTKDFTLTRVYGGVNPDWTTYVFRQSEEKPDTPAGTKLIPDGWEDAPTATGRWWMSRAVVSGITKQPGMWSEPVQVTCEDGSDTDFKYAKNNSENKAPGIVTTDRYPSGWTDAPPSLDKGEFLWMSKAKIKPDNTLLDRWSDPVRISGEKGYSGDWTSYVFKQSGSRPAAPSGTAPLPSGWEDGPGSTGKWWMSRAVVSGITGEARDWSTPVQVTGQDGNGMHYEYAVSSSETAAPAGGWSAAVPSVPSGKYLWMRWGQVVPPSTYPGSWDGVARVTGEKGEKGLDGINGKDGNDGLSINYLGERSSAPSYASKNDVYKNTGNGIVYIYNGAYWEKMIADGTDGVDGTDGADGSDGYSVYITYHDNPLSSPPATPTGNGTAGGWHTKPSNACIWMSQKVSYSATGGTWGSPMQIRGDDGKDGQDGQDANLLDWVKEWNGTKTTINGESILSPKAYFGTVSAGKLATGVLLGYGVHESGKAGIYGLKNNEVVFKLDSEGNNFIGGFTIEKNSLTCTGTDASINFPLTGNSFLRINGTGENALVSARNDGKTAIAASAYGNNSTGLYVLAQAGYNTVAIKSYGNVELKARNGELIKTEGLAVNVRVITSSGSVYSNDDFLRLDTTAEITLSLPPASSCRGKIIYVKQVSTGNYTLSGTIRACNERVTTGSLRLTDNRIRGYISDGNAWNEIYLSYN